MKLSIMQPYLFPYIGYFQLINAVDKFVFYDDVNFIKSGWINRNRILVNGKDSFISVQLLGASSNKLINEVNFTDNRSKLLKTIEQSYKKAPYFSSVFPIIQECLEYKTDNISELAILSVELVCKYLGISTVFEISSQTYHESRGFERNTRIWDICKKNQVDDYINSIGGTILYDKQEFKNQDINLLFIQSGDIVYKQFGNDFVPYLSIIDILMFNSKDEVGKVLGNFKLI